MIELDFFAEPDGTLHIEKHSVAPADVDEAFNERPFLAHERPDGSYLAFSRLGNGRVLQIVFRRVAPKRYFMITAFDVEDSDLRDLIVRELE